jgi:hypothetical protein
MPNVVYNCCYIFGDSDFFWSQIGFSTCSISIYILAMCLGLDIHLLWLVIFEKIHNTISYTFPYVTVFLNSKKSSVLSHQLFSKFKFSKSSGDRSLRR